MPISRASRENPANKVTVARYMRGKCGICHEMITAKEAYLTCVGGTNTSNGYLAHYNCYKSTDAPRWEELKPEAQKVLSG
jgi:hypothetical protein